jgi:PKHD-type hydroxylase
MNKNYSKNFYDHYTFNVPLNKEIIDKIINLSNLLPTTKGLTQNSDVQSNRKSNIKWIYKNDSTKWLFTELKNIINYANNDHYGFNITNYDEAIQFTEYSSGGKYGWHSDQTFSSNSVVRKLSIVIQLSSPQEYLGGLLQIKQQEEDKDYISSISRKLGLITVFPSFLHHRVTHVAQGNRKSLVWWVGGPPFK